jgi:excisionase family DNA binding protein
MADGSWRTPVELARELRCSPQTIYRAIGRGDLPALRLGPRVVRVAERDWQQFIGKAAQAAAGGV